MSQDIFAQGLGGILTKRLGMKPGGSSPAPILTPEVTPVIALEVDRPEWSFLAGDLRVSTVMLNQATDANGAGNFWVVNPANSGVLAVIEHFWIKDDDNDACLIMGIAPTVLTGQSAQTGFGSMDSRALAATATSPLLLRYLAAAQLAGQVLLHHKKMVATAPNEDMIPAGYPVILQPGTSCTVFVDGGAMDEVEAAVQARVRVLQPQELV